MPGVIIGDQGKPIAFLGDGKEKDDLNRFDAVRPTGVEIALVNTQEGFDVFALTPARDLGPKIESVEPGHGLQLLGGSAIPTKEDPKEEKLAEQRRVGFIK